MKILIFGAGGMVGHKIFEVLTSKGLPVYGTFKRSQTDYNQIDFFKKAISENKILENIDLNHDASLFGVLDSLKPDIILNCVGITLRKEEIKNLDYCLRINSFLPHKIRCWAEQNKAYLVHFSTDCVFSGKEGQYIESSYPSANDNYGRTKYLGEVMGESALTLRGSMIGRELYGKTELLEWAFAQNGKTINGFSKAIYSGVTTDFMAQLVHRIITDRERLTGIYQVSSAPMSKFELLKKLNDAFKLNMTVLDDSSYESSKILISDKLKTKLKIQVPSWDAMIAELAKEKSNVFSG